MCRAFFMGKKKPPRGEVAIIDLLVTNRSKLRELGECSKYFKVLLQNRWKFYYKTIPLDYSDKQTTYDSFQSKLNR